MTPRTKKILFIGGAAVVGYIIYSVVKKPDAAAAANPKAALAEPRGAMQQLAVPTDTGGVEEDLGVSEDLGSLGSLGGAYR